MAKTSTIFMAAFAAHGAGRFAEAEQGYRAVLKAEPKHADAWHLLGVSAHQQGRPAEAADYIRKALKFAGPKGAYLTNLGASLQALGRSPEALTALEQAVTLDPSFPAHFALGNILRILGRLDEALARYERALALKPTEPSLHNNIGNTYQALGRLNEAAASYRKTITYQPGHARAHYNLGVVSRDGGQPLEAIASLRKALAIVPDFAEAHVNLGVVLHDQGQTEEALRHIRRAIALKPDDAAAHNNLGAILRDLGQFDEAMQSYDRALVLRPSMAEVQHNQGVALQAVGRDDEALARYQQAQGAKPEFADAKLNIALLTLMTGNFETGWEAYECRWRRDVPGLGLRHFPYPQWQGEDGGAVLVWGEQGVGDRVLYASMIPDLLARGHSGVMETNPRLIKLFERSFPGIQAVAKQEPPHDATQRPDIRWQSAFASLGRWLRPDLASFPARDAYLVADDARQQHYRAQLETNHVGPIIGISWISRAVKIGPHKTAHLKQWAHVLQIPGVRFVDLQYGETADERADIEAELGVRIEHVPDLDLHEDIDGVAALAAACDFIISVSNTTAHLSAALGRPTYVLVPASAGNLWYWMRGHQTPWYPTATILRQSKLGHWDDVMEQLRAALAMNVSGPLQRIN